jgi:hypothetical protein|tara:strand:+ start:332 stop:622 length:291 start_codon:yes stop_codon:yes gene_type:complete
MNVKLMRMRSGEDVVADLIEESDTTVTVANPIVAIPNGQGTLGFAPWAPLLAGRNTPVTVPKDYLVYGPTDTQEGVVEQFEQMFGIIETPSKKLVL